MRKRWKEKGGKEYFEFLEEEFQTLTTQLQKSLGGSTTDTTKEMEKQFTRCGAVYQQMRAEALRDDEYQERLKLYKIQLKAFQEHYKNHVQRQEIEITFDPDGTLLRGAQGEEFPPPFQARPALGSSFRPRPYTNDISSTSDHPLVV